MIKQTMIRMIHEAYETGLQDGADTLPVNRAMFADNLIQFYERKDKELEDLVFQVEEVKTHEEAMEATKYD